MTDKMLYQILVQTQDSSIEQTCSASQGEILLEALNRANIDFDQSCGGNGTCGTCLYTLESGSVAEPNELEAEMASERGFSASERLACQSQVLGHLKIRKA